MNIPTKRQFEFLNVMRDLAYQESKAKGWHSSKKKPNIAAYCINLTGEVCELWEAWRKKALDKPCDKSDKMAEHGLDQLTNAEEELADIIIRAFDTAATMKVDLAKAVRGKLLFNRTRPHRNGGKMA